MSINGLKGISSKGRGRQKLLQLTEEILEQRGIAITNLGEIFLVKHGAPILRWSAQCSRNQFIRSSKRLRISLISNGQKKWGVTPPNATKVFIVSIIRIANIQPGIIELSVIIWSS